jgi:hypothetical protein
MQMLHVPSLFSYLVESYIVTDKIQIINDLLRRKHAHYMLFLVRLHDESRNQFSQVTNAGGIDSLVSIPALLKRLQIRAQKWFLRYMYYVSSQRGPIGEVEDKAKASHFRKNM